MSWGTLRLTLQTESPGVSLDLIDQYLNSSYETVLEATDWSGLKAHAMIQTVAAYQSSTDTVTVTVGSAAVTGLGTTWTGAITGLRFYIPGDTVIYTATQVSGTGLTLDRPYEGKGSEAGGTASAGVSYVLMQNVYPAPADCRSVVLMLDPRTNFPLDKMTKDVLDISGGSRARLGHPTAFAPVDDSPETSPPVLHQVELYPPPLEARGFPIEYIRAAFGFDGENTGASQLPFISDSVLLYGARSAIAMTLDKLAKGQQYYLAFEKELTRLLQVEHAQRRDKTALRMASRFTRHRLLRAARGARTGWRGGTPGGLA